MNTQELTQKFRTHAALVPTLTAGSARWTWHLCAARGYRKLLAELALLGDEAAGNTVLGAPHFVTFSDETVARCAS